MSVRDFDREEHEYLPGLRFRSLTFVSEGDIELAFDGLETENRTFRVAVSNAGGTLFFNFDEDFTRLYRQIPGPVCGKSLNALVGQALDARRDQLPAGPAYEAVAQDMRETLERRWAETHKPPEVTP